MSEAEGFQTLKDWLASGAVLESYAFSLCEWPLWRRVQVQSLTETVLSLVEHDSNLELPPLDIEGAEITRASARNGYWPFEDVPHTEFKCTVFLKLKDGKHILLVEPL